MFGRRRRGSSSNPPLDRSNVNPNAATAAASAFLSSKPSSVSLASAAAGAALRSRPTTPTSVGDVQTKRTLRRNGSTSSAGSSVAGSSRPTLERKSSSGSMSERTFRDQSPGRGSIREAAVDAPPVPAIPQNLKPAIPPKSHKRSTSLEATPGRISSPAPSTVAGRGSSMGPLGRRATPGRGVQRGTNLSSVQELTSVERPASRGSVNFSYPTNSPRAMSPTGSTRLTSPSPLSNRRPLSLQTAQITQNGTNLVYDPNTRSFRPIAEVLRYDEITEEEPVERRPIRKKKTVQPNGTGSGSQIADGTHFGGPKGTAVNALNTAATRAAEEKSAQLPIEQQPVAPKPASLPPVAAQPLVTTQSPSTNPAPAEVNATPVAEPKKKKKKRVAVVSDSGSEQGYTANQSSASDNESDASDRPRKPQTRPIKGLQKRPSVVKELPEDDESGSQMTATPGISSNELGTGSRDVIAVSPTPLLKSNGTARGKGRGKASASAEIAQERLQIRPAKELPLLTETSASPVGPNGSAAEPEHGQDNNIARTVSESPARTTRFAPAENPTNLVVMHQPPSRSISPRKSALKHSNSPRGPSPAGDMPGSFNRQGQTSSDLSDNSTILDERTPRRKKKTARVSFDDSNTVVGTAASPICSEAAILPSPQNKDKRSWFGRKNKGTKTVNLGDDEEDDLMKPRPMLPSFGSVRERKVRESTEERPLVMPSESQHTPQATRSSSPPPSTSDTVVGVSNDAVVGSVLARDAAIKNVENTPKFLEPLPPVVTSVEGSGYSSDSSVDDNTVESHFKPAPSGREPPKSHVETDTNLRSPDSDHLVFEDAEKKDSPVDSSNSEVPKIALTRSTPTLEDTTKREEWLVPGGFPSSSDSESQAQSDTDTIKPSVPSEITPASVGIAEPPAESIHLSSHGTSVTSENLQQNNTVPEETDESDHDSVYSDAAEDFSDGDGFLSMDAVASSPIKTSYQDQTPGLALSTPPDSPLDRNIKEKVFRQAKLQKNDSEPDMGEGWEKAQEYWAGLTADKKRELEKEAREDSETSEDEEEEEATPLPSKPNNKKKVMVNPLPVELPPRAEPSHRTYQITPGSKATHDELPTLRSSMRAAPPSNSKDTSTQMRKSMRNGGSMRESSETAAPVQPRGALQKRPLSYQPGVAQPDPLAVQKHLRHVSAAPALSTPVNGKKKAAVAPQLKRSNSTDSDSSFKRIRPIAHSMRGSMRNPVTQDRSERATRSYSPDGDKTRSSRFSIRSLSPTGSAFRKPFNGGPPVSLGQGTMRGTMRNPTNGSTKTSFGSGFGRAKAQPKSKATSFGSRRRFDDSSDEEDARPVFRSRFHDSSDEEDEPAPLPRRTMRSSIARPVTAPAPASTKNRIPVVNEGESSDLPDSDDEKPDASDFVRAQPQQQPAISTAPTSLGRSGSGREHIPLSPILRDAQKQRGNSFLKILRRKNDPSSRVRKAEGESGARKDTPLERSRSELLGVRQNSSGLLHKRTTPSRTTSSSEAWPLNPDSPSMGVNQRERPATADNAAMGTGILNGGVNGSQRPSLGTRRSTATGILDVDIGGRKGSKDNHNVVLGRNGKPKRFQGLRRVLGIKD